VKEHASFHLHRPFKTGQRISGLSVKIQKSMLPDQYDTFSNLLKNHFGRNPYFERRNGRHPMPPEEQQLIRQTLERVGMTSTMEFDDYKDAILW
jgi:CRISPR/Cas system endoribonuclease Cas6 (RAMP superfamily)